MEDQTPPEAAAPLEDDMDQFFIRDAQNEGIKVPLVRPDGTESDHWLTVYGNFSDTFQRVRREVMASAVAEAKRSSNTDEREAANESRRLRLLACLIKDWSFDKPCSEREKVRFLQQAPQIGEAIDRISSDHALFTKESSAS